MLGEATERAAAQVGLLIEGLAAALVILLLLQAAFGSWRLSFLLFLTLPAALVGGVLAAWAGWARSPSAPWSASSPCSASPPRNGILLMGWACPRHLEEAEGVPIGPELVIRGAGESGFPRS